jgi:hypothetical protein
MHILALQEASFKKHYFRLFVDQLQCFKNAGDSTPKMVVPISEAATVSLVESPELPFVWSLQSHLGAQKFYMACVDQESCMQWV